MNINFNPSISNISSNYSTQNRSCAAQPSFGSLSDKINRGTKILGESVLFKFPMEKLVNLKVYEWVAKHCNARDLSAIAGVWLSGFYMLRTAQDKKIEPERKKTLMWNMAITTVLATTGAYCIDKSLNKAIDSAQKIFEEKHGQINSKAFRAMVSTAIFTLMYRFISPILATPLAHKATKMFLKNKADGVNKAEEAKKA